MKTKLLNLTGLRSLLLLACMMLGMSAWGEEVTFTYSDYQGQGIGKHLVSECIKYIDAQLKDGWKIKIVIVSAKGKESFYEQFGFIKRPNDKDGAGMNMWRQLV